MRRIAGVVLFLLALLTAGLARAQGPADIATARALFKEGSELSRKGQWQEAVDRFTRSLALKRAPLTLYSLGVAQKNLGLYAEGLESFRAFLAEPSGRSSQPFEQPARDAVAELEKRVAYVRIQVEPRNAPNLVVMLDGVAVPEVALDHPRMVNPGAHAVSASADGHESASRDITLGEGASEELSLVLKPSAPVVVPKPRPRPVPPPTEAERPFPVGPVALMAAGGVVLAVGIAVGVVGVNEVPESGPADDPAVDSARAKAIAGDVLWIGGSALAAAGLVWLIVALTGDDTGSDRGGPPTLTDVTRWRF